MRALALPLALLTACSLALDPDDLTGGVDAELPAPELCDALVSAYCDAHQDCCDPDRALERPRCLEATRRICEPLVDIASDTRAAYDAHAGGALLERALERLETCDPTVVQLLLGPEGLISTLEGTVPPGDTCSTRSAPELGELFSCMEERACVRVASSRWSCLSRVGEAASCRIDGDCEDGLYCDSGFLGLVDGSCAPKRAVDEPCDRAAECESLHCTEGLCRALTVENVYCALEE